MADDGAPGKSAFWILTKGEKWPSIHKVAAIDLKFSMVIRIHAFYNCAKFQDDLRSRSLNIKGQSWKNRIFWHFQPTFRVSISHNSSEGRGRALKLGRTLHKGPTYLIAKFQNFVIFRTEMTVNALRKCIPGTRLVRRAEPTPNPIEKIMSAK